MKNILLLIQLLFLYNCAKPLQTSCSIKINKSLSKNDPTWFKKKEKQEYNYIVKNKESSGDKDLAQTKNLLVSEIILANKTAPDFMSCKDQNKALYTIRNSDLDGVSKLQNGKIISDKENSIPYKENALKCINVKRIKVRKYHFFIISTFERYFCKFHR